MPIEYLGNKSRLLDFVLEPIRAIRGIQTVADLFCGTASVSAALCAQGKRVIANDHLELCATLAEAALLQNGSPTFEALELRPSAGTTPYEAALRHLNHAPSVEGFFLRTYSPAADIPRMYLTERNAAKIDGIRARIADWEPLLTRGERAILLRDLVSSVAQVSNTAGTFGCFLKAWKKRALEPVTLLPGSIMASRLRQQHEVWRGDAEKLAKRLTNLDAAYLDPPYTKRQYAAYYHLLDTLVSGTMPVVSGSTGLPQWEDRSSEFCYRRKAPRTLERLVYALDLPHIFLSYSDDGHITHEEILEILGGRGILKFWELPISRYRSSSKTHRRAAVRERLYHLAVAG